MYLLTNLCKQVMPYNIWDRSTGKDGTFQKLTGKLEK